MNGIEPIYESQISVSIIEDSASFPADNQNPNLNLDDSPINIDDRRQYIARIPIEIDLHITTPEKKGMARSIDVSVTGLLVQTFLELQWEERVIITILHPEEDTHACATVARIAESDENTFGNKYGLRILSDDAPIWQGVLRRLVLA
mgnify:CR=1 FL=1